MKRIATLSTIPVYTDQFVSLEQIDHNLDRVDELIKVTKTINKLSDIVNDPSRIVTNRSIESIQAAISVSLDRNLDDSVAHTGQTVSHYASEGLGSTISSIWSSIIKFITETWNALVRFFKELFGSGKAAENTHKKNEAEIQKQLQAHGARNAPKSTTIKILGNDIKRLSICDNNINIDPIDNYRLFDNLGALESHMSYLIEVLKRFTTRYTKAVDLYGAGVIKLLESIDSNNLSKEVFDKLTEDILALFNEFHYHAVAIDPKNMATSTVKVKEKDEKGFDIRTCEYYSDPIIGYGIIVFNRVESKNRVSMLYHLPDNYPRFERFRPDESQFTEAEIKVFDPRDKQFIRIKNLARETFKIVPDIKNNPLFAKADKNDRIKQLQAITDKLMKLHKKGENKLASRLISICIQQNKLYTAMCARMMGILSHAMSVSNSVCRYYESCQKQYINN